MCHPAQMPAETRTSYAGLPEAVGRTLLDEARQSGRQAPAPHRHLARDLEAEGIGYAKIVTDEPLDAALRRFLTSRSRGA